MEGLRRGHQTEGDTAIPTADGLADLSDMILDPEVPRALRSAYATKALGNPRRFRAGGLIVELAFTRDAPALQDLLFDFLRRKTNGL